MNLSDEQKNIVEQPYIDLVVDACAGSGKTTTAVERLIYLYERFGDKRNLALLSYSNVAINEFKRKFYDRCGKGSKTSNHEKVYIATIDSFITNYIISCHSYRYMACETKQAKPFLVFGSEPFLFNYKVKINEVDYPCAITDFSFLLRSGRWVTVYSVKGSMFQHKVEIADSNSKNALRDSAKRLMAQGAYTHNMRSYIALRTIESEPKIIKILSTKFPYIVIDEAQDVGTIHKAIFEKMCLHGTKFCIIGDSKQAIFDFAGADGSFLSEFLPDNVVTLSLTENRRSIPSIITTASSLSPATMQSWQTISGACDGAYYVEYKEGNEHELPLKFQNFLKSKGYEAENSVLLARCKEIIGKICKKGPLLGQGAVKDCAEAAILRDKGEPQEAFEKFAQGVVKLLGKPPQRLFHDILHNNHMPQYRDIRKKLWIFFKNVANSGLPPATGHPKTDWLPILQDNMKVLLEKLKTEFDLKPAGNLGNKLSKAKLGDSFTGTTPHSECDIRVDTVHKVKGETLDAVLYVTSKRHLEEMLNGTGTEDGRIGYVAITRAKRLFIIGILDSCTDSFKDRLNGHGIVKLEGWEEE